MFSLQIINTHIFACLFLAAYASFSALNNVRKKTPLQQSEELASILLAPVPKGDYFGLQRRSYLSDS
jgi:hypothetical protein